MTAAWIFDALPGLLALVVAAVAYVGTRRFVMRARSTAAEAQATPEVEPAPASAEAALSDAIKAHEAVARAVASDVIKANEALALAAQKPTLFESSLFGPPAGGRGLGFVYPGLEAGITGQPFYELKPEFQEARWWAPDLHPATGIAPEEAMERLVRAMETSQLATAQLVKALRGRRLPKSQSPDQNEEAKEPS